MIYKEIQTKENYDKLLNSGMFYDFYPELSGNWNSDFTKILNCVIENTEKEISFKQTELNVLYNKELCNYNIFEGNFYKISSQEVIKITKILNIDKNNYITFLCLYAYNECGNIEIKQNHDYTLKISELNTIISEEEFKMFIFKSLDDSRDMINNNF